MEANTSMTTIDDLPENVLLHILSFSPTLDAISTSILARSWRNLWHEVPGFRFDIVSFYKKSSKPFSLARASFADRIRRAFFSLPAHRAPLQYFQLAFHHADFGNRETEVCSWIRSAVQRGVLKLEIHFYDDPWMECRGNALIWGDFDWRELPVNMHETFEFQFFDIMNTSVTDVQLHNCGVSFPSNESAGFESLKKLVLRNVRFTHTNQIKCLLSVCVNLEILNLEMIQNLGLPDEFHLRRLKKLTLKGQYRSNFHSHVAKVMDIYAPELLSLTVDNFGVGSSLRIDMPSLVEADLDFTSRHSENCVLWQIMVINLQSVESLRIQNMGLFRWNVLDTFSYLKKLELITGFSEDDLLGISAILKASPMLESVIIDCHYYKINWFDVDELTLSEKLDNEFVDLKIPRLREITMKNYRNTRNELYLVDMIKKNNVILKRIVVVPPKGIGKALSPPIVLWELKLKQPTLMIKNVEEDLEHDCKCISGYKLYDEQYLEERCVMYGIKPKLSFFCCLKEF